MKNENNIVACYIRVSTDSQTEYSPDAQLKAIKDYAKKNNLQIDSRYIYKDEGISGRKAEKRPAFMEMIKTAKTKPHSPFCKILVHKFDRFARNREDSIVYKSLLKKECKVDVISITEDFGDDKFSVILEAMLEAMAEYYSLNLSDEVKKGMTEKANRGEYQTKAPFGYQLVDKQLKPDLEQSKVVKMIYNDYLNGLGFQSIAKKLNKMLIKTNQGNKWEVRTIEYILRNPVYKGYTRWTPESKNSWNFNFREKNGITVKGNFEEIINEETWDKINNIIERKKEMYKNNSTNSNNFHWLKKLVKCSNCGSTLTTQKNSLQCIGYSHGSCNVSHYIVFNKIEKAILEQLKKDFENPISISFSNNIIQSKTNDYDIIISKIKLLEEKAMRIKNLYLEGIDTLEEFKQNKKENDDEIKILKDELKNLKPINTKQIKKDFSIKLESVYKLMTSNVNMKIKYETIHSLIDHIVYDKINETIEIFYK